MADRLDFAGLRAEVEAATRIPEFEVVAKRARKIRRRGRLAMAATVLGVLGLLGPAGVASVAATPVSGTVGPDVVEFGPEPDPSSSAVPAPIASVPPLVTVAGVDGVDLAHAYALVDVCYDDWCNLQLVPVRAASGPSVGPAKINLLRDKPTDVLTHLQLRAQTAKRMLVSAQNSAGQRVYDQVDVSNTAPSNASAPPPSGQWPNQPTAGGVVSTFDLLTGKMSALPAQPPLDAAEVVPGIAPSRGIWVTGASGGVPTVAVSRDGGRDWTARQLDLPAGTGVALATYDGGYAYLLARTPSGFRIAVTADGGQSWQVSPAELPWPAGVPQTAAYGLAVRPDGGVLAWVATTPTVSYLQSTDHGQTFRALENGPGGVLYQLPDGYVTVGLDTKISRDAATWTLAKLPYLLR